MDKNSDLENAMKKYMDSNRSNRTTRRNRLRELLKNESVDTRYQLLMNVRGVEYRTWSGPHESAYTDDLEIIRDMLDGFPSSKKYDVLKMQDSGHSTPLHNAAYCGYSPIITYLMTDLSQQQKYNLLKIQDQWGNTALHDVATNNKVEAFRAILSSVPYHMLLELLNIKNNKRKSAVDIRPKLKDELLNSIAQGMT